MVPHDCSVCGTEPGLREAWGCDRATERPQVDVPEIGLLCFRCPNAVLRECDASTSRAFNFWAHSWRRGILPSSGGLYDQAATFVRAMDHLDLVAAKLDALAEQERNNRGRMDAGIRRTRSGQ